MEPLKIAPDYEHADLTRRIIGCYFDVYNELGFGFLESIYHRAMIIALTDAGLIVETKVKLPVTFRGQCVGNHEADLIVNGLVILELKTAETMHSSFEAQLLNYLKATVIEIGLLLNFGPKPVFKRLAFDNTRRASRPQIDPSSV